LFLKFDFCAKIVLDFWPNEHKMVPNSTMLLLRKSKSHNVVYKFYLRVVFIS